MGLIESLMSWKQKAGQRITHWCASFQTGATDAIYASLVGMGLLPLLEALQTGAMDFTAVEQVLSAIGCSLLASELKTWHDTGASEQEMVGGIAEKLPDPEFRQAADTVMKELNAVSVASQAVPAELQAEFVQALTKELERYGNVSTFKAQLGDLSVAVHGDSNKVAINGQIIEGGVKGDVLGRGASKTGDTFNLSLSVQGESENQPVSQLEQNYLEWILERDSKLALDGIDPAMASGQQEPIRLNHVYTTLMTLSTDEFRRLQREREMAEPGRTLAAVEVMQKHKYLVLLGDPGGGKSTFVNYVSMCMAGEMLGRPEANLGLLSRYLDKSQADSPERIAAFKEPLLPVKVVLRDYVSKLLERPGLTLWQFMAESLNELDMGAYAKHLKRQMEEAGGLILLDGLDEVPQAQGLREKMIKIIGQFCERFSKCRILVTSRTYAYEKQQWQLPGFAAMVLASFNPDQIEFFVRRWYKQVARQRSLTDSERDGRTQRLLLAIMNNEKLGELARRPILLTLMAGLHAWRGGTLPDGRQELYQDIFPLLMDRWEQPKFAKDEQGRMKLDEPALSDYLKTDKKDLQNMLERLAYDAHASQEDSHGTADISAEALSQGLMELCEHCSQAERPDPVELRRYLQNRAGILQERGTGVYAFPHRSFQEYLAACHCTGLENFTAHMALLVRKDPDRWREVCLLAAAEAAGMAGLTWNLVDELFNEKCAKKRKWSAEDHWGMLLAAQVVAESCSLKALSSANQTKLERLRKALPCLMASDFAPTERALAGRLLARLGDPRPEVMKPEGIEFLPIPAGSFWMGGEDRQERTLEEFYITRYPVSNAQYRQFVESGGYQDEQWWPEAIRTNRWDKGKLQVWTHRPEGGKDEEVDEPADYGRPYSLDNHPRVGVCWYEALACCHWLTEYLKTAPRVSGSIRSLLEQGWHVGLPSEAQWEKAARGSKDKRGYPWGDEADPGKANYVDTKIGSPSALGCFPQGRSPYECEDMVGNVEEWCHLEDQDVKSEASVETRESPGVIRGGAFYYYRNGVRCSARYRNNPNYRNYYIGFRVSLSPFL